MTLTKNQDLILNGDFLLSRNINHGHVHANIANGAEKLPSEQDGSIAIAQTSWKSIGITNPDGGNPGVLFYNRMPTISNRFTFFHILDLRNGGLV